MATVYYQDVDELWSRFKQELSVMLQTAYQLPEALQVKAAMEMEEVLFMWKKTLNQSHPSTDEPCGNVSPYPNLYATCSPPSTAEEAEQQQLGSDTLSNDSISHEPLSNEPLSNEALTNSPEVKFTQCKVTSESGDEELVIAITDVPPVDSGSSDNDADQSEDTAVSADPLGGSTTPPGRKTVKRKCSPRKCKSDLGIRTDKQHGSGTGKRTKMEGEEGAEGTVRTRRRGRPQKGMLMRPRQTASSYYDQTRTYRKIAPKPVIKSDSDQTTTATLDIPMRKRGRPKRCFSDASKIWTHKCHLCGKLMATKASLAAHIRVHTGEKPYQCEECGKSFSQISGLSTHRKRHRGIKEHHCQYCDFAAIQSIDIIRHEMRHHTKEKPFLCDLCGRGFIDVWSLKNHINTHSKHIKDYTCDKCDFKTHSPDILRAHTRNMHQENRKMYKCPICDLVLRYQDTFSGHMRRHYGEKPFACKVCEASFASNSQLAAHKRIHQERLYACPKCDKKFINPHKLRRHEVVHTGAKEFKCPVCAYMCNVKSNLKKHCTAVHKIEYPPPDMRRIKIISVGTNSDAAEPGNSAENSISSDAGTTPDAQHDPSKTPPSQQEVQYLDETNADNGLDTTGQLIDQQSIASKLQPEDTSVVADNHNADAGNFLLFINECGITSTQPDTSTGDGPVQQSIIVMQPNPLVIEQAGIVSEDIQGYGGDNVCELRFEQV